MDFELLAKAEAAPSLSAFEPRPQLLASLRSLRRIILYETYYCLTVIGADGRPLPYWQPAMQEPLDSSEERLLFLMARPWIATDLNRVKAEELLDFIYDDLYGDAYGGVGAVEIPGYRKYLTGVRERVDQAIRQRSFRLGSLHVPWKTRRLLRRAKTEGLFDELSI